MLIKSLNNENLSQFSNIAWRNLTARVCNKIDKNNLGLQIISPFGFELLEDKRFLYKSIKRLYCYIGIPIVNASAYNPLEISNTFSNELMSSIHEVGIKRSDIAIQVTQDRFTFCHENNYQCSHSDKLIDIQTRIIKEDILLDYANYIICSVDSICSNKDEAAHFFKNKRHRSRTYQLYVMLENIFGYLLPSMTEFQKESYSNLFKYIDNSIQMFYSSSELFIDASHHEEHLLNSLIIPRVSLMLQAIQSSSKDELIKLGCDAYYVKGKLELIINKNTYKNAVAKIKMTYLNFI